MNLGEFATALEQSLAEGASSLGWPMEGVLRLLLAAIAGGLVGMEREVRGREAGFRTNLLVCLGSALVMLVSIRVVAFPWDGPDHVNVTIDPARIAYGIMTGVGFLGAGAIIHHGGSVRGLTTAAALWCVASLGMAIGFGHYLLSAVATVLIVIGLWLLDYLEGLLPKVRYRTITIRRPWSPGVIRETIDRVREASLKVLDASFKRTPDLESVDIDLRIAFVDQTRYFSLERELEKASGYILLATREV